MSKKINVVVIPITGSSATHEVDYVEGMSVKDALDKAGIRTELKSVTIATCEVVTAGNFGNRVLKDGERVEVSERPQGS